MSGGLEKTSNLLRFSLTVIVLRVNSNLSTKSSQNNKRGSCYLQPSTEVVGKANSLLVHVPHHIFFSGAIKIPQKKKLHVLEATHRSPTSLAKVEYYA